LNCRLGHPQLFVTESLKLNYPLGYSVTRSCPVAQLLRVDKTENNAITCGSTLLGRVNEILTLFDLALEVGDHLIEPALLVGAEFPESENLLHAVGTEFAR